MPEEPQLYENRLAELLPDEIERFEAAGLRAVRAPSDEFDALAEAGNRLIYVVLRDGTLVVCRDELDAHHSVIARGGFVRAAGELNLAAYGDTRLVLDLNEQSGHYLPDRTCRAVAAAVLRDLGFEVPDDLLGS